MPIIDHIKIDNVTYDIAPVIDAVYPIGSIYLSVSNTNPGNLFGGTWVAFGAGRTLVGVDTSDADFDTVEETGGEKTHVLTIQEMPSHNHTITTNSSNTTSASAYVKSASNSSESYPSTGDTGGGQAHNNLQPYITVYMWKRTA